MFGRKKEAGQRGLTAKEQAAVRGSIADPNQQQSWRDSLRTALDPASASDVAKLEKDLEKARKGESNFGEAIERVVGDKHLPALQTWSIVANANPELIDEVLAALKKRS